jgi:hypothetical protein
MRLKKLQLLSFSVIFVMLVGLIGLPSLMKSSFAAATAAQGTKANFLGETLSNFSGATTNITSLLKPGNPFNSR